MRTDFTQLPIMSFGDEKTTDCFAIEEEYLSESILT